MVVLEYQSPQGRTMIDFEALDRDFKEFQSGKSQLNSYITQPVSPLIKDIRGISAQIGAQTVVKRP